jgi:rsbT co-antagonist protein RsbR
LEGPPLKKSLSSTLQPDVISVQQLPTQEEKEQRTMRNWSIRFKLLSAFGMNLFFMLVIGGFAIVQMGVMNERAGFLGTNIVPALNTTSDINVLIEQYRAEQLTYSFGSNPGTVKRAESAMRDIERQMTIQLDKYRPLIVSAEERAIFTQIETTWSGYTAFVRDQLIPSKQELELAQMLVLSPQSQELYAELARAGQDLIAINNRQANDATSSTQRTFEFSSSLIFGLTLIVVVLAGLLSFFLSSAITHNVTRLTSATTAMSGGQLEQRIDIRSGDELGVLAQTFNRMSTTIRTQIAEQRQANDDLQRLFDEVQRREAEQALLLAENAQQRNVIRELSIPVLPLQRKTLAVPLVGALDSGRLFDLQERVLDAIQRSLATRLLLDITGVPVVDTLVAQGLISVVQAARLLGTEVLLVGIRPEVALTIVSLGLDLHTVRTYSDIQSALGSR